MKPLQISQDIITLARFKTKASQIFRQLHEEQRPVVVTQNGQPAAVLITPEAFDRLQEHDRFLEAVQAGLADSEAGGRKAVTAVDRRALVHGPTLPCQQST